jgi:hypothetical protein
MIKASNTQRIYKGLNMQIKPSFIDAPVILCMLLVQLNLEIIKKVFTSEPQPSKLWVYRFKK